MNTQKPNHTLFYALMLGVYCLIAIGVFYGVGILSRSAIVNNATSAVVSVKLSSPAVSESINTIK